MTESPLWAAIWMALYRPAVVFGAPLRAPWWLSKTNEILIEFADFWPDDGHLYWTA